MKYLVAGLLVVALLSIGLYYYLTQQFESPPVTQSPNTPSVTKAPMPDVVDDGAEIDLTALDRDITEIDNFEVTLDTEVKKL